MIVVASEDGVISLYSWKGQLVSYYSIDLIGPAVEPQYKTGLPKETRVVTTLSICNHNTYLLVSTCTENTLHSPCIHLLKISMPTQSSNERARRLNEKVPVRDTTKFLKTGVNMIKLMDELPLNNLSCRLSEKKSSYIYDLACGFYFENCPIFIGYQCHFEK